MFGAKRLDGLHLRRRAIERDLFMSVPPVGAIDLREALKAGVIDAETYERLVDFYAVAQPVDVDERTPPRFDFVNLLWYLGALIVIGAMGCFRQLPSGVGARRRCSPLPWVTPPPFCSRRLSLEPRGLRTPGGLLIACAVGMAPLCVFALQSLAGFDPSQPSPTATLRLDQIELVAHGTGNHRRRPAGAEVFPFPFLVMPIAFALWFMSMDLTPG